MSKKASPPGVDDRLLKRRLVEKWLATCRRGEVNPKYLSRAVRRIYEESGRIFLDILLRDLEAEYIRDRHLAAGCLLELPVTEEVKSAFRRVVADRRRRLWARGICLIALSGQGDNIEGIMRKYPELSEELPTIMARQYIDALCDEDLSNGHGWEDFRHNPEEVQIEVVNLLADNADDRVVDFLWWAAENTSPKVQETTRRALAKLRLAGADVDRGRGDEAKGVSPLVAVREGHTAMKEWNFARAIFHLSGALQRLAKVEEVSYPVRLQLVTALLRDGQTKEALHQAEELASTAGPEHFYGQKAGQLVRAIAEVLLPEAGPTVESSLLDPVEASISDLLQKCGAPSRFFDRALVLWDSYLRYTLDPIGQIDDASVWAAAAVWVMSWVNRDRPHVEDIQNATAGLPVSEVKQRAKLIWNTLGLGEDTRWLRREMSYLDSLAEDDADDEVGRTITEYLEEMGWERSPSTVRRNREGLQLLQEFLSDRGDIESVEEITPEHLVEFHAFWYFNAEGIKRSTAKAKALMGTVWRFCQWMDIRKGTQLASEYYPFHRQLRVEVPRALEVASQLPDPALAGPQRFERQVSDFFSIESLGKNTMEVQGIRSGLKLRGVTLPHGSNNLFEPSDILYLTLGKRKGRWHIIDCGPVYPPLAAPFVKQE